MAAGEGSTRCSSLMIACCNAAPQYSLGTACGLKLGLQITISLFETAHALARERAHRHAVMLIPRLWRHERGCVTQVAVMQMQMKMPIWHVLMYFDILYKSDVNHVFLLSFWPVYCHEKLFFGHPNCLKYFKFTITSLNILLMQFCK